MLDEVQRFILPIVEYYYIDWNETTGGAGYEFLPPGGSLYSKGVREALGQARGIYLFYDSRGKAIYAGKAQRQDLLLEMRSAYNRDRGEFQSLYLVNHPERNVRYEPYQEKIRQPAAQSLELHWMASYFSAYEIKPTDMIPMFEALIVRAFANDLLNKRMEKF